MGIAIAGAILGEAGCFLLFKYGFTNYVRKKCDKDIKWATVARVSQQEGFKGVMIIRYSIIPPRELAPHYQSRNRMADSIAAPQTWQTRSSPRPGWLSGCKSSWIIELTADKSLADAPSTHSDT